MLFVWTDAVVTYEQLRHMLSTGSVQLFDVREADELEAGFIPGAANIPCECKVSHTHTHFKKANLYKHILILFI